MKQEKRTDNTHRHTHKIQKYNTRLTPKIKQNQAKTNQAKLDTPNFGILRPNAQKIYEKNTEKNTQTTKQHSKNRSKKANNKNSSTICDLESATSEKITQDKRQTLDKMIYEQKIYLTQTS